MTQERGAMAGVATDLKGLSELRRNAREHSPEAARRAAQQFESVMLSMVMKSMREASPGNPLFDSEQGKMFGSMLDTQMAQAMAARGVGLADMLAARLSGGQGAVPATAAASGAAATPRPVPQPQRAPAAGPKAAAGGTHVAGEAVRAQAQAFHERFAANAGAASAATGIPAAFLLGQAALESGWGKREIRHADGSPSHNLFSVKAGKAWTGKTVDVLTTEFVNGAQQKTVQRFRSYDSYEQAFSDYANLLKHNARYRGALSAPDDAGSFAMALQRAGYATDPRYAAKLTNIINQGPLS